MPDSLRTCLKGGMSEEITIAPLAIASKRIIPKLSFLVLGATNICFF